MDPLRLDIVARAMEASPLPAASAGREATGIAIDSRVAVQGDLFFALEGENTDGHRHLAGAANRGAVAAVVRRGAPLGPVPDDFPLIEVDDPRRALGRLAIHYRARLSATVVGITGSNGKTTTRELVAAVLGTLGPTVRSEKSYNNDLGVPLTLLRADASTRFLVVEVGTSHPGEIAALAAMVRPHVAVVTNIAEAHLGNFGTLRAIAEEKSALLAALPEDGVAVIPSEDAFADLLTSRAPCRVCTFGRLDAPAADIGTDVWGTAVRRTARPRGVKIWLYGKMKIQLRLQGLHNASNALAAVAVGLLLGAGPVEIAAALGTVRPQALRLQRESVGGVVIVDDSYNANPASMEAALDEVEATVTDGRRVLILGDMGELGDLAELQHRRIGHRAAAVADVLWCVGENARWIAEEARARGLASDRIVESPGVEIAIEELPFVPAPGDLVLVKASRAAGLDRLAAALRTRLTRDARSREAV
jgi:UDP-N-acetylmuramoyl-tripeptide--D-alanyl-D-alanine ligase